MSGPILNHSLFCSTLLWFQMTMKIILENQIKNYSMNMN